MSSPSSSSGRGRIAVQGGTGHWAVVAVGAVNLAGAVVALIAGSEGAPIGLTVSAVAAAAGIAYARTTANRQPHPA